MKRILSFILVLLPLALLAQPAEQGDVDPHSLPPTVPLIQCDAEDATIILKTSVSIAGVFEGMRREFYLRPPRYLGDFGNRPSMSIHADGAAPTGRGIGYGYSASVRTKENSLELILDADWTIEEGAGRSEIVVGIPYHLDLSGSRGGFTYTLAWIQMEKEANQPVETTPASAAH